MRSLARKRAPGRVNSARVFARGRVDSLDEWAMVFGGQPGSGLHDRDYHQNCNTSLARLRYGGERANEVRLGGGGLLRPSTGQAASYEEWGRTAATYERSTLHSAQPPAIALGGVGREQPGRSACTRARTSGPPTRHRGDPAAAQAPPDDIRWSPQYGRAGGRRHRVSRPVTEADPVRTYGGDTITPHPEAHRRRRSRLPDYARSEHVSTRGEDLLRGRRVLRRRRPGRVSPIFGASWRRCRRVEPLLRLQNFEGTRVRLYVM